MPLAVDSRLRELSHVMALLRAAPLRCRQVMRVMRPAAGMSTFQL